MATVGFTTLALGLAGASGASAQSVDPPGVDDGPDVNGMLAAGAANAAQIEADSVKGCHASAQLSGSSGSDVVKGIHALRCDQAQHSIALYALLFRNNEHNGGQHTINEGVNNCRDIGYCGVVTQLNNGNGMQRWNAFTDAQWKARWWSRRHRSFAFSGEKQW
jgi:hypothetical protein